MTRIEALTPEQEALLPVWRERWRERALCTDRCDRPRIEAAVAEIYRACGHEPPKVVVWMDSPIGGCVAGWALRQFQGQLWDQLRGQLQGQLGDQLRDQLRGQLAGQLQGQLGDQLRDQLWGQLQGQLWGQLWGQLAGQLGGQLGGQLAGQLRGQLAGQLWGQLGDLLWGQLRGQLGGQLGGQLQGQLGGQLQGQLRDQLWGQLQGQLRDQLAGQLRDQLQDQLQGQLQVAVWGLSDTPWVAWWAFARHIGVRLTEPQDRWLTAMESMCGTGWWWPFEGTVVLTERPAAHHFDGEQRLHNVGGPAIEFGDGWAVHALHGVRVAAQFIERPETLTPAAILANANSEQRRVLAERYGWDRLCAEVGTLVDSCDDPGNPGRRLHLYGLPDALAAPTGDPTDGTVRLLVAVNGSPDRHGANRIYGLTVPADMPSALAAAAWTYRLDPDVYATAQRRT